ncbi:uncharacterized protein LOC132713042 [Ruditapes philippinarum]|uniref:uncharacterized protein LOC132713042 n=1 Tax=Ruditapes philippinarum TaxID=129788 RepID=UPI00295B82BB|nr:uncharacterized protein LOC132713042 [Ruditapes philippinarum]
MRRCISILFRNFRILVVILVCWVTLNCVLVGTGFLVIRSSGGKRATLYRIDGDNQVYNTPVRASPQYFVFSVIALNSSENENYDIFTVNTWSNQTFVADDIYCCYLMRGGKLIRLGHLGINQRSEMFNTTAQVECPNPTQQHEYGYLRVAGVTVSTQHSCTNENIFREPYYPLKVTKQFSFAVCGKIIYGDINIALTVEWMEYHKYMGVNKVILYPYKLSVMGSKLLKYYRSIGFVDVVHLTLPPSAETHRPGMKTKEAWNIEQLVVHDCQGRLSGYQYVGVIDLDEFIVPVTDRNLETMMNKLLYILPNMSAVEVYGEMFILDWPPTNKAGKLVISKYEDRTISNAPVDINQRKLIHIPARVQRGSVVTHGCKAHNSSYTIFKDPLSIMNINHYRKCVHFRDDCFTRARIKDKRISRFTSKIETNVQRAKQKINKM